MDMNSNALRQACGVAADYQEVICDGVSLAVSRAGKGRPVVCLHAIAHGGGDYHTFADALQEDYEIILLDWPGHGRSGPDREPPSAGRYADLLEMLLEKLNIPNPILVGNSIGGAAAILYASRRPTRGLVLCDSAGLLPVNAVVRTTVSLFVRFFRAGERNARWFPHAYRFYYRRLVLPSAAAAAQREQIIRAGTEYAPLLRQAWESFARPAADIRALVATLDIPIWVAWCRGDQVIPLWMCRPAIRRMRHAQLTLFSGGHAAFLEQPQAFIEGFRKFAGTLENVSGIGKPVRASA